MVSQNPTQCSIYILNVYYIEFLFAPLPARRKQLRISCTHPAKHDVIYYIFLFFIFLGKNVFLLKSLLKVMVVLYFFNIIVKDACS